MNRSSFHPSHHSSLVFHTCCVSQGLLLLSGIFSCAAVRRSSFHHPQLSCKSFSNVVDAVIVAHLFEPALEVSSVWGAWQLTGVSCALSRGFPFTFVFSIVMSLQLRKGFVFFTEFQDWATSSLPQQSASCEQGFWQVPCFFSSQTFIPLSFSVLSLFQYCRSRH